MIRLLLLIIYVWITDVVQIYFLFYPVTWIDIESVRIIHVARLDIEITAVLVSRFKYKEQRCHCVTYVSHFVC